MSNWWQEVDDPLVGARLMVRSLYLARGCSDPRSLRWQVGQHPGPPGDGEPVPGEVLDLMAGKVA